MYGCESWTIKKAENWIIDAFELWCWRVLSSLDGKEIKPGNPKGDQSWMYIGRTDDEAEAPILWSPIVKSWLMGKDPDAGKNWGQEENRGWDGWMASLIQWTWVWGNSMYRGGWHAAVNVVAKNWTRLSDWTTITIRKDFRLLIIHTLMDGARHTIEF